MADTATLHIDGASRGNPGPAAYAVVLTRPGLPPVEAADVIGTATNNVAEYTALIEGLSLAAELGVKKLSVFSDSELLVKQMRDEYRVKNEQLRSLYEQAKQLAAGFEEFQITHVRREQNRRADQLGNEALDGRPRKPDRADLSPVGSSLSSSAASSSSSSAASSPPVSSSVPAGLPSSEVSTPSQASGTGTDTGSGSDTPTSPVTDKPLPPAVGDAGVRDAALEVLRSAARVWAVDGIEALPVEAVWEQLWSVLHEGGVLRKKRPGSGGERSPRKASWRRS